MLISLTFTVIVAFLSVRNLDILSKIFSQLIIRLLKDQIDLFVLNMTLYRKTSEYTPRKIYV